MLAKIMGITFLKLSGVIWNESELPYWKMRKQFSCWTNNFNVYMQNNPLLSQWVTTYKRTWIPPPLMHVNNKSCHLIVYLFIKGVATESNHPHSIHILFVKMRLYSDSYFSKSATLRNRRQRGFFFGPLQR